MFMNLRYDTGGSCVTVMLSNVLYIFALVVAAQAVTRPPGITKQAEKNIYFKPGETVNMTCEAEGDPKPSYQWKRNEIIFDPSGNDVRIVQLPGKGTLVISKPEDKDEGIYQCFAKNSFGISASVKINLREAKLKKFDLAPETTHEVKLGQKLMLNCVPPESVPPAEVYWIVRDKYGGIIPYNYDARVSMDREYRLRFAYIKKSDSYDGNGLACHAKNQVMREIATGPMNYIKPYGTEDYQVAQYFWADQSDQQALVGRTFSIKCIFSGNPTPDVHWRRTDNKPISERAEFVSFGQELRFKNIQKDDAGDYECWATNTQSQKNVNRPFKIRVQSAPIFIKEPKDIETGVGSNIDFNCEAYGDPEPVINWFVNAIQFDDLKDPRFVGRLKRESANKLFMLNVTETDQMVVQCNASNLHGYAFSDVYLNVLSEAPSIIEPPAERQRTAEGAHVMLSCKVTGKPDPIITWFKDGEQITGGRFEMIRSVGLRIKGVVLADAGHYKCQAQNTVNGQTHIVSEEGSLVVRRKTLIEQRPGDLERNAGVDGKFTCSGTTDPEEVNNLKIVWYKDGKKITTNDQRITTNKQDNSLTISGTIVRDSGTYMCVATNGLDNSTASALLTVKDRPDAPTEVTTKDCNKKSTVKIEWMPGSYNNAPVQYFVVQYNTSFNPDQWHFGIKVNSTENKVTFPLSPYVEYTFRVIAYNKIGPSEPSFHSKEVCKTKEARPDHQPRNLRTIGFQPNKLYIEWTPIPPINQNGPSFSYNLQVRRAGQSTNSPWTTYPINDWTVNHKEIDSGEIYQPWDIKIKALNSVGEADGDPPQITGYSAEGRPQIQPSDLIVEKVGDTYADFTWQFRKSEIGKINTKIRGEFMGFKIQFWEENEKEYTIREENISPDSAKNTTGDTFRTRVRNMLPNTRMVAHIAVMNNFYVGEPTDQVRFTTNPGLPGPVKVLQPRNIGDTHINLEWSPPEEDRGDLLGYDISYRLVKGLDLGEMQEREPQINDPYATNAYLSGLKPKSKYRVYIAARTIKGRGESYFIEVVTGKPGNPRMPKFSIVSVGRNNINITWWIDAEANSGTVVFVEYRKLDGAEWLRTTDEVVHTWKNIENLEAGTKYEVRLKTTNGKTSLASAIDEVTTDGTADAYALIGNIGWFLGMIFSILLIIALVVVFFLCYKRGFRFERDKVPYNAPYSGTYDISEQVRVTDDTVGVAQDNENFGPEPAGYNNDYYDRRDYQDYNDDNGGFDEKRPPSYSSEKRDYEPYDSNYEKQGPPRDDDYYYRGQPDDYRDGRDYDYNRGDSYYDGRNYDDRRDDHYDDRYYDRRDDYYNGQGEYENDDRRYDYDDRHQDYDRTERRPSENEKGKAPSTFV